MVKNGGPGYDRIRHINEEVERWREQSMESEE